MVSNSCELATAARSSGVLIGQRQEQALGYVSDRATDFAAGIALAIHFCILGGIPAAIVACVLRIWMRSGGAAWKPAWSLAFLAGLLFQVCSVMFALLLAWVGGWRGSAIPIFLWATVVSGIPGVMLWRRTALGEITCAIVAW